MGKAKEERNKDSACLSERMNSTEKRQQETGRQAGSSVCLCQATLAYCAPIDARGSAIDLIRVNGIRFTKRECSNDSRNDL